MLVSKKRMNAVIIQSAWLMVVWVVLSKIIVFSEYSQKSFWIYLMIFMSLVIGVIELKNLSGKFLTIPMVFLLVTYVFHHGQHLLGLFGIEINYYHDYIMTNFSDLDICKATFFSIFAINFLQLGMCLVLNEENESLYYSETDYKSPDESILYSLVKIIFIVCILPSFYYDVTRIAQSFISSYGVAYTYGANALVLMASRFFEFSCIALFYVNRNTNKWKYIFYPKIGWELIKLVFIGNRMGPIISILAFCILKRAVIATQKRDSKIKNILILLAGVYAMGFISALRANRGNGSIIKVAIDAVTSNNAFVSFFTESGTSLLSQTLLFRLMPNTIQCVHGLTYINSLLILIPFSTSIFGVESSNYISVGAVLNSNWYNRGLGGSIVAEVYYNFEWLGLLAMLIIGVLVCIFSNSFQHKIRDNNKPFSIVAYTFVLEQILIYPRDYFYSIISYLNVVLYVFIAFWILKSIIKKNTQSH